MAKLLNQALLNVRAYYIQKLMDGGFLVDDDSGSSYTMSELKKEYTILKSKEQKERETS